MKTIDMRFVRFAMCISTLLCSVCLSLVASPSGREYFVKTRADIIVFPRASFPVIKNNLTRVLGSFFERTGTANNLLTKYTGSHFFYRELQDSKDQFVLKTSRLVANVRPPTSVGTGAVLFSDNTGITHFQEQPVKPVPRRSKTDKKYNTAMTK
jgi:hypothetical protein